VFPIAAILETNFVRFFRKAQVMYKGLVCVFILFSCIHVIEGAKRREPVARFKNARCSTSNITMSPNYGCFVKAYNRKVAKLNVFVDVKKPVYEITVRAGEFNV
jgi:hypothetical protein